MGHKKLTLYIDEDIIKASKKIAIDSDMSLSQIVNDLLARFINQHDPDKSKD